MADLSSWSMQFFVAATAFSRMEITTGKLSSAMRILLLLALEAIPESNVSEVANPKALKRITNEKKIVSKTGFPNKIIKRRKPEKDNNVHKIKL